MYANQLDAENIKNLTRLWKVMGSSACKLAGMANFQLSSSWPHRCWLESKLHVNEISSITRGMSLLQKDRIVPVWKFQGSQPGRLKSILQSNSFDVVSEQTAMYLEIDNDASKSKPGLLVKRIDTQEDIQTWTTITARAFDYEIDRRVIQHIASQPGVHMYMAYSDYRPAATVMLFKTGSVTGIHQLGVLPEFRGKGIARNLMHEVIRYSAEMSSQYLTLQASKAAEQLYRNLGFRPQFRIKNYQRTPTSNYKTTYGSPVIDEHRHTRKTK